MCYQYWRSASLTRETTHIIKLLFIECLLTVKTVSVNFVPWRESVPFIRTGIRVIWFVHKWQRNTANPRVSSLINDWPWSVRKKKKTFNSLRLTRRLPFIRIDRPDRSTWTWTWTWSMTKDSSQFGSTGELHLHNTGWCSRPLLTNGSARGLPPLNQLHSPFKTECFAHHFQ